MKNLIYLSVLVGSILSVASCTKSDLPVPNNTVNALNSAKSINPVSAPVPCDSAKLVDFVLTGDGSYEVAFSGKQNYTFFLSDGKRNVSVKPGTYSIFIYSPGNYTQHTFYFDGIGTKGSGARYDNVSIKGCSITQTLEIE